MDYLKFFISKVFCLKFRKRDQIQHCNNILKDRLDIIYILKRLTELEKLKMILLNNSQRKLFEFLPKPLIKINSI